MTASSSRPGIGRRALLAGSAGMALGLATGAAALPRQAVSRWDVTTDVLVVGSGAAGICAAIQARQAGARVLVIETLPRFGGASIISGGVVYAGGGTALQRSLGIEDSAEHSHMYVSFAQKRVY